MPLDRAHVLSALASITADSVHRNHCGRGAGIAAPAEQELTMTENDSALPFEIGRPAHIARRRVVHGWVRDTARAFAQWLGALPASMSRQLRNWAARQELRAAIRELNKFDDRTLADIGVTRGEIELLVRDGRPADRLPRPWHVPRQHSPMKEAA
jgi:uncharacterized protein YjiS (DUF1127 family)